MLRKIIRPALGLMLYQLTLLLFVTGGKLKNLVYWDAVWYRDIAVLGYDGAYPFKHEVTGGSNIAFFPAFPLSVRGVIALTGLDPNIAVAVAAQLACIALWAYFLLILKKLNVRTSFALAACLILLVQPGAFYTVIGYSEALFTASMLGYLYWTTRLLEDEDRKPLHFALALMHGAVLSSTRIVGLALLGFALLLAFARSFRTKRPLTPQIAQAIALGGLSLSGFAAYIAYCHFRWGHWDAYWEANRVGWRVYFDPWKMLHWAFYRDVFFFGNLPEILGRLNTVATLAVTAALSAWAWRSRFRTSLPLALSVLNLGLLFQTIIGSHGMHSMTRYLIPIHALTFAVGAVWLQERSVTRAPSLRAWITFACLALFSFAIQIMFTIRYSHSDWIS